MKVRELNRAIRRGLCVDSADRPDTWNDTAVQMAWDDQTPENEKGVAVYAASKTESEQQAWKWMKEHQPQFQFNTVLPCFNVCSFIAFGKTQGTCLTSEHQVGRNLRPEILGSTMGWTRHLLEGNSTAFSKFPERMVPFHHLLRMKANQCFRMVCRRRRRRSPVRNWPVESRCELRANLCFYRAAELDRRCECLSQTSPGQQTDPESSSQRSTGSY